MSEDRHWIETKQELEVDEKGGFSIKKKTREAIPSIKTIFGMDRKDFWDLLIKVGGLLTIAITILSYLQSVTNAQFDQIYTIRKEQAQDRQNAIANNLTRTNLEKTLSNNITLALLNQQADLEKEKARLQLETFISATTDVLYLINTTDYNEKYRTMKESLYYEIYPKILLLNDPEITEKLTLMKRLIELSEKVNKAAEIADKLAFATNHLQILADFSEKGYYFDTTMMTSELKTSRDLLPSLWPYHDYKTDKFGLPNQLSMLKKEVYDFDGVTDYDIYLTFCQTYIFDYYFPYLQTKSGIASSKRAANYKFLITEPNDKRKLANKAVAAMDVVRDRVRQYTTAQNTILEKLMIKSNSILNQDKKGKS